MLVKLNIKVTCQLGTRNVISLHGQEYVAYLYHLQAHLRVMSVSYCRGGLPETATTSATVQSVSLTVTPVN